MTTFQQNANIRCGGGDGYDGCDGGSGSLGGCKYQHTNLQPHKNNPSPLTSTILKELTPNLKIILNHIPHRGGETKYWKGFWALNETNI